MPPVANDSMAIDVSYFNTLTELAASGSASELKSVVAGQNDRNIIGYQDFEPLASIIATDITQILETISAKTECSVFSGSATFKEEIGMARVFTRLSFVKKTQSDVAKACQSYIADVPSTNYHKLGRNQATYCIAHFCSWGSIRTEEEARVGIEILQTKMWNYSGKDWGGLVRATLKNLSTVDHLSAANLVNVWNQTEYILNSIPNKVKAYVKPVGAAPVKPPVWTAPVATNEVTNVVSKHVNTKGAFGKTPWVLHEVKGGINYCWDKCRTGVCGHQAAKGTQCRFNHDIPSEVVQFFAKQRQIIEGKGGGHAPKGNGNTSNGTANAEVKSPAK